MWGLSKTLLGVWKQKKQREEYPFPEDFAPLTPSGTSYSTGYPTPITRPRISKSTLVMTSAKTRPIYSQRTI